MLVDIRLKGKDLGEVMAHYLSQIPPIGQTKITELLRRHSENSEVGMAIRQAAFAGMFFALGHADAIECVGGCPTLNILKHNGHGNGASGGIR